MSDKALEAPDADAAEQDQDAIPAPEDAEAGDEAEFQLEVSAADRAEQARELSLDDDEYR
jgi:hypothetical protein